MEALTFIIQGPPERSESGFLSQLLQSSSPVILVSSTKKVERKTVIEHGDGNIEIYVPDVGPDVEEGCKPNNFRRWHSQVINSLPHVETEYLVVSRSDIELNIKNIFKIVNERNPNLFSVDTTTLSPWVTGVNFHFCDWVLGGKKDYFKIATLSNRFVKNLRILEKNKKAREFGYNFCERYRSEQLIFAGLLPENLVLKLEDRSCMQEYNHYEEDIIVIDAGSVIKKIKGNIYRHRYSIIRRPPEESNRFLFFVRGMIFGFRNKMHRALLFKYIFSSKGRLKCLLKKD